MGLLEYTEKRMATHKCGSKMCWAIAMVACFVIGLIFIIVPIAVGGCDDGGACGLTTATTQSFNGCEKGDYDASQCAACYLVTGATKAGCCQKSYCKYNDPGLTVGGTFGLLILGIILIIVGCVFICGVVPCCCFAGPDVPAAGAPAAATAAPVEGVVVHGKM